MTKLTDSQEEAIKHFKGPALVIAGPGAGKTFVITERVKRLITDKKVDPKNILVTTFTEKAANELKVKLAKTVGKKAELIHISTIHSFCKAMLEKFFLHHEYGADIDVLDGESQKLLIDLNRVQLGISYWKDGRVHDLKPSYGYINVVTSLFNRLSQNQIDPDELIKELKNKKAPEEDIKIIEAYKKYLETINKEKKIDFDLLQTYFYKLIQKNKTVLEEIQNTFQYILVDEYQDTSSIQDKIFRTISGKEQNIFVVGDENQSIYGFRGASIVNFKKFIERFKKVKSYLLNVNFRSTKTIVEFSNKIFEEEVKKILKSRRRQGEKIKIVSGEDSDHTAQRTIELIKELKEKKIIKNYGDIALLFRSLKGHSEEFIKYLNKEKIPFVTFGDGKFLERDEIRTLVYLMSYVTQQRFMENQFKKWSWWKKDVFLSDFFDFSLETKNNISKNSFNLYDLRDEDDFKKAGFKNKKDVQTLKNLNKLRYDVEREKDSFGDLQKGKNSLIKVFYKILDYSGYFDKLMPPDNVEKKEILQNLGKLSEIINRYMAISKKEDVKGFVWYLYTSGSDIDQNKIENENTLKLMTVHQAKGLEFPIVFLCCLNEGRFPLRYRADKFIEIPSKFFDKQDLKDEKEEFLQEERRLFYVGLTRAQDNLIFTTSNKHRVQSWKKSMFLEAIPKELISDEDFKLPAEKEYRVGKEIANLNYSAINTFIDCPLRYNLIYNYGFVTPQSFMQSMGSFIHNTLQRIHETMKRNNVISPKEMKDVVDTYWIDLPLSEKKNESIKQRMTKYFVNYYITVKDKYKKILAIEESFSHIDDNMIIKGKVDLIVENKEGKTCLIDFKAREKKGIEETNVDKQLQIYDYCLDNEYKIDKIIAHTFMDNEDVEFPIDLEKTKAFLLEISDKMSKEEFPKQKNNFCRECPFNFHCWGDKK